MTFIPMVVGSYYLERKTLLLPGLFHQVQLQLTQMAMLIFPVFLANLMFKILQFKFQQTKVLKEQEHIGKVEAVI